MIFFTNKSNCENKLTYYYKFSADIMCRDYENLFINMLENKKLFYDSRNIEINKNKIFEFFYLHKRKRLKSNFLKKN